jgi:hypothetical protein
MAISPICSRSTQTFSYHPVGIMITSFGKQNCLRQHILTEQLDHLLMPTWVNFLQTILFNSCACPSMVFYICQVYNLLSIFSNPVTLIHIKVLPDSQINFKLLMNLLVCLSLSYQSLSLWTFIFIILHLFKEYLAANSFC